MKAQRRLEDEAAQSLAQTPPRSGAHSDLAGRSRIALNDQGPLFAAVPEQHIKRFEVWYAGSPARRHITEKRARAVLDAVPVKVDKLRLLELGASWGFFSFLAAQQGAKPIASDLLVEDVLFGYRIAKLNGYGQCVYFCVSDALRLPFPDECFDLVVSIEMTEHIEGGALKVCEEMHRVTKPRGFVVISTPNPHGLAQAVKNFLKKVPGLRHRYDFLDYDEWYLTKQQLTSVASSVGLELAALQRVGLTVPSIPLWLFRLNLLLERAFQLFPFLLTTAIYVFRRGEKFRT
jgi:2-polyprenyl-3-methyl-5-hydroxy-6-metoxy-1,4-benzoquinol methylase